MDKLLYIKIVGIIFGFVLLIKIVILLFQAPIALSNFIIDSVNLLLNIFTLVMSILGPLLVIYFICEKIFSIHKSIINKLEESNQQILSAIKNNSDKIFPIFLASLSQVLLIFLSNDFAGIDTKAFLSIMLWLFIGLLLIVFNGNKKGKILGLVFLVIVFISSIAWLFFKYKLYSLESLYNYLESILNQLFVYPMQVILSIFIIVFSFIMIIAASLYYGVKK